MSVTHTPNGGICAALLCDDPVLSRFLEIELARYGIRIAEKDARLYLWDLDSVEFRPSSLPADAKMIGWSYASPEDFPLLADVEGRVFFLHRPFSLDAFAACIRSCVTPTPTPAEKISSLLPSRREGEVYAPASPWTLTPNGVRFREREIPLTSRERALFRCLWEHRGTLVPKAVLREVLDVADTETEAANTLEVYIYRLRCKIEKPLGCRLITTERGKGYRWETEV